MDYKKIFIFCIFVLPVLFLVSALSAVFGLVGATVYGLAFAALGSPLAAAVVSGCSGLAIVAFMRYGVFRRLPMTRLQLKDIYGFYIAFFVGFLISPYLATVIMSHFGDMLPNAGFWLHFIRFALAGCVPVLLAMGLDKLGICKLPTWDKSKMDPWNDGLNKPEDQNKPDDQNKK